MRKLLTAIALLVGTLGNAQDPVFSQFYAAPLQLNPAFAGSSFAPRFGGIYRNQWPGINQAYQTYAAFYEQSIDRLNSGFGVYLEGDNAGNGILKSTNAAAFYAYRMRINDALSIKLGLEAGLRQTAINWDLLVFPDQLDPLNGAVNTSLEQRPDQNSHTRLDLSTGLLLQSDRWWAGFGLKHLNTPNQGFLLLNDNLSQGLPLRYTVQGGMEIRVNERNKAGLPAFISPNFLFVSQGPYQQINLGAYAGVGPLFGGVWFRHTFGNADAAIFLVGFREGIFKLGLSYDATVSGLANQSGGAYELSLGFLLDKDEITTKKHNRSKINNCMGMFQ
ncbi:MAG: type IX secretion system membrane protein PorP/SprF [Lewinellaceae bacterium]|nr:type IX secretion system membrane protein PorP/SprF [Lewinellaceae bacterium]